MRCYFENSHNELDYAWVGDYKPQLYIRGMHTHQSIRTHVASYILVSYSADGVARSHYILPL